MTPLYAYDFDKTLVPYDSFRRYLKFLLRLRPVRVGALLVLRRIRLISSANLKARVTRMVVQSAVLTHETKHFAQRLIYDVKMPQRATKGGVVLIISASPYIYMHLIADLLQCELLCSDSRDGQYIEMYGTTKADYLERLYPPQDYSYVYAASDSESDLCWMKDFKQYDIIDKQ
ncbi:MAG: haloacid dehalogenase-like hydrolase [Paludibacteraceae bacterium]|nr:haloacid dehalogenase-like hydrolase [Paludibacteraceae bacterium]